MGYYPLNADLVAPQRGLGRALNNVHADLVAPQRGLGRAFNADLVALYIEQNIQNIVRTLFLNIFQNFQNKAELIFEGVKSRVFKRGANPLTLQRLSF